MTNNIVVSNFFQTLIAKKHSYLKHLTQNKAFIIKPV